MAKFDDLFGRAIWTSSNGIHQYFGGEHDELKLQLPHVSKKIVPAYNIESEREYLLESFCALSHRCSRRIFRVKLLRNAKYYATLSHKHPAGSYKNTRFMRLSRMYEEVLCAIGEEPAPKPRKARPQTPICYPKLADDLPLRLHFLAEGSLRRERAEALSQYVGARCCQRASTGETYQSVALSLKEVRLYERLVETLGEAGLRLPSKRSGGFSCYDGSALTEAAARIADDNNTAQTYSWRHTLLSNFHGGFEEPAGKPKIPDDLPWDVDPVFQQILEMTQADDLDGALSTVDAIDPKKREILFDEVMYLKFCQRSPLKAHDLRYVARKYVRRSPLRKSIEAEFGLFLNLVDPHLPDWDELAQVNPWKQLRPWPEFKKRAYRTLVKFGHPIGPRGRLFVWHPDIYSGRARCVDDAFFPSFRKAEDEFRRKRQFPRIGRRWNGERALVGLVSALFPDAIPQWSPPWLGRQSVDIYVPSLNVALEYQGEQHFRPIEFFGGEQAYRQTQARDAAKRRRLVRRGVILIEWHHSRPVNGTELNGALAEARIGIQISPAS